MNLVSIILPNLNTNLQFLKERVNSILAQKYKNWECIVVDGYSDNGSWEFLISVAKEDPRFKIYQFKKEGIYKAWNSGIELASGNYIYIAPSDDTMQPEFLTKMVKALDDHTECGIAHCCLSIINEYGKISEKTNWDNFYPAQYFKGWLGKKHIRIAPHDGILHCGIKTVYTSITQLLIRKSVFDNIGLFLTQYGSIADFEWGMRASLIYNVVHIPEYLATWRNYEGQATQDALQYDPRTYEVLCFFISHAFETYSKKEKLDSYKFNIKELQHHYREVQFDLEINGVNHLFNKVKVLILYFFKQPTFLAKEVLRRILKKKQLDSISFTTKNIQRYNLTENIYSLDTSLKEKVDKRLKNINI